VVDSSLLRAHIIGSNGQLLSSAAFTTCTPACSSPSAAASTEPGRPTARVASFTNTAVVPHRAAASSHV
jgi:hypothetical protein